ncbi:hypothetical protein [Pelagibius sp. Alg239-R121]|uniref:hypothetical protein n=1 Tax=Pelagibius sp. Alg239-R121 TaxID=2993448 RepID=UPI0024A6B084|nr:hypothetical protein [Pelagibius sp. Alg239-R121]
MTHIYDWYSVPDVLAVKCPGCGSAAVFEFADIRHIQRRKHVAAFKRSRAFEYHWFQNSWGNRWHGAVYYHGLRGTTHREAEHSLPKGYLPKGWAEGRGFRSHNPDFGTLCCPSCNIRRKHRLTWPEEAFFQVDYRGKTLWAFDRDSLNALRSFIASKDRKRMGTAWASFLFHIPGHFLSRKARAEISKKLDAIAKPA